MSKSKLERKEQYLIKLKDPRWQKKRLEIFERDKWKCQCCHTKEETLHVHHKYYTKDKEPWDYADYCFITLCENCHHEETFCRKEHEDFLLKILKEHFLYDELCSLAETLAEIPPMKNSEHFMSYILSNLYVNDLQRKIDEHIRWQIENCVRENEDDSHGSEITDGLDSQADNVIDIACNKAKGNLL